MIQFDKLFHPVVLYEKYCICNDNLSNERKKNLEKLRGNCPGAAGVQGNLNLMPGYNISRKFCQRVCNFENFFLV